MSRKPIHYRTRVDLRLDGRIEIVEQAWMGEDMTNAKRVVVSQEELAPILKKLGWREPLAKPDKKLCEQEIDRRLSDIAAQIERQPMLAFVAPDKVLVGGTITAKQAHDIGDLLDGVAP